MRVREPAGTPIPGSRFVRDYCRWCREPIRVPSCSVGKKTCDDCSGRRADRARTQGDAPDRRLTYLPEHGHEGGRRG